MRFVVVDDDETALENFGEFITRNQDEITPLYGSDAGVQYLGDPKNKYDLLICDGLEGGWERVYGAVAKRDERSKMILYSRDEEILEEAKDKGIRLIDKSDTSVSELLAELSPKGTNVEGKR